MLKKFIVLSLLLPILSWAAPSPENILTQKCLNSYEKKYKNKKAHKVFVYAREEETGKNRCQWQYGDSDVETARRKAIEACADHQLNAECIIVDIDNEYLVKDGDFTLITPVDKTPISDLEKKSLVKESKKLLQGNCLSFYEKSFKDRDHRVFAYSIDANGNYACGKSNGGNLVSAQLSALKACEGNKVKRRKKAPKNDCKVYAENRKILLSASDFGITVADKSEKTLSDDEYNVYLDKAKKVVNKGPCFFQMKYYLRGTQHQAFYLATDDEGKQTCGRSDGAFSPEIANKLALEKCEKNLKKSKLKASCALFAENFEFVEQVKIEKIINEPTDTPVESEVENKAKVVEPVVVVKPKLKPKPIKILTLEEDYQQAIYKGDLLTIKKHIEAGLDVNLTAKDGVNPLFIAAARGDVEFFNHLLDKGANIQHKTKDGSNVLIAATFGQNIDIIRSLLKKGFDVNTKGRGGFTPLHLAIKVENKSLISFLIKEGADATINTDDGISPVDMANELKINLDELKK